jgi:hypothetical protein
VEESLKHRKDAVVAHLNATEVLQPGVDTFDFPALAITAKLAFVLEPAITDFFSVGTVNSVPRCLKRARRASES